PHGFECTRMIGPQCTDETGPKCTDVTGPECTDVTGPECTDVTGPECTDVTGPECTELAGLECTEIIDPEQFSYFAVVIQWDQREAILFDGTALFDRANVKWVNVTARNEVLWSVGHYKFIDAKITKHVLISVMNVFGCYFYGYTPVSGYMYPGGYIVSPINLPCSSD
uniref:IgGFc-binding protein N-terminal domain-containing protein n=1 Tax=Biomphalaria glabrata TaxID=6526 RepID=A0A2C9KX83_BIOGL